MLYSDGTFWPDVGGCEKGVAAEEVMCRQSSVPSQRRVLVDQLEQATAMGEENEWAQCMSEMEFYGGFCW